MIVSELLAVLTERNVRLSVVDGRLRIRGASSVVDPSLRDALQEHRDALLAMIVSGEYTAPAEDQHRAVDIPPNRIPYPCEAITPDMLPLIRLSASDIERIVGEIPGGARNVADIYPLAPLQEGILFHHLLADAGDPYLLRSVFRFDSRAWLDGFVNALQAVIDRHDILRTSIHWDGLAEPVQVVWRRARLLVEEVETDPTGWDVRQQLDARFDPRRYALDIRLAPLMRAAIAFDGAENCWYMVLLFHHLVSDHVTLERIVNEIVLHLSGRSQLLPSSVPYRNFVAQSRLGVGREEHEAFFKDMLGDVEEPTIPLDLYDVHGDGSAIAQAEQKLPPQLSKRLRAQSGALGVSVASFCHLAWARVLGALTGRDDVVFGTVLFGRMQGDEGTRNSLGLLVNTLPIRIAFGDCSVRSAVHQTHKSLAGLLHHEHASLALAQRCSVVAAPAPLFGALLNYRHTVAPGTRLPDGPRGIEVVSGSERTNYPLTLSVDDFGEDLVLTAQVAAPLEPRDICGYTQTALEQLVAALERDPSTPVTLLRVLSEPKRKRLLVDWNATQAPLPADRCIHQLFEEQVRLKPDAVAVEFEQQQLTYAQLNAQANRLARYLRSVGVKPDTRVALCFERGIEMVVAVLGILKAGGAYVPLDPSYPLERLEYMLQDSAPVAVLTHSAVSVYVQAQFSERVLIDLQSDAQKWSEESTENPAPLDLAPEHLAYVIYTSGSTGRPKGVMVEHRALVSSTCSRLNVYESHGRTLLLSSIAFDSSLASVFGTLCSGGTLVVPPPDALSCAAAFQSFLEARDISTLLGVPSLLNLLFEERPDRPHIGLRNIIFAGEPCPVATAARVAAIAPRATTFNEYGPTECTVWSTVHRWSPVDAGGVVPIGRPIPNARVYILDARREPVPVGASGELYLGGAGVARGYLNRPDLTAQRFIDSPFIAGDRLYRTGDLARYLPDGTIKFLGRNDDQVKIRGFRIELGEIESRLTLHESINEAIVVVREDAPGEKRLVAYCTPATQRSVNIESLREHLAATLPDYMIPAAYVQLESLPRTPNGKLDRRALPAPRSDTYVEREYEAPLGELEETVARIWSEVLGREQIGRNDDFFELGGHSLLAVRVIGMLGKAGISNVTMAKLFMNRTLRAFASILKKPDSQVLPRGIVSVRPGSSEEPPLFLIHELHGLELYFPVLAAHIDRKIPVYGLPGVPLDEVQLTTVESMAARMITLMKAVHSEGVYRIAGWSFGGILAYEIARQLLAQGESVGFVGLIDSYVNVSEHGAGKATAQGALIGAIRDRAKLDARQEAILDGLESLEFDEAFRICAESQLLPTDLAGMDAAILRQYCVRLSGHLNALHSYVPKPISVPIHLYAAAEETPASAEHPLRGWDAVVPEGQIRLTKARGTHLTIFDDRDIGQTISAHVLGSDAISPGNVSGTYVQC